MNIRQYAQENYVQLIHCDSVNSYCSLWLVKTDESLWNLSKSLFSGLTESGVGIYNRAIIKEV